MQRRSNKKSSISTDDFIYEKFDDGYSTNFKNIYNNVKEQTHITDPCLDPIAGSLLNFNFSSKNDSSKKPAEKKPKKPEKRCGVKTLINKSHIPQSQNKTKEDKSNKTDKTDKSGKSDEHSKTINVKNYAAFVSGHNNDMELLTEKESDYANDDSYDRIEDSDEIFIPAKNVANETDSSQIKETKIKSPTEPTDNIEITLMPASHVNFVEKIIDDPDEESEGSIDYRKIFSFGKKLLDESDNKNRQKFRELGINLCKDKTSENKISENKISENKISENKINDNNTGTEKKLKGISLENSTNFLELVNTDYLMTKTAPGIKDNIDKTNIKNSDYIIENMEIKQNSNSTDEFVQSEFGGNLINPTQVNNQTPNSETNPIPSPIKIDTLSPIDDPDKKNSKKEKIDFPELNIDMIGTSYKVMGDLPANTKMKIIDNTHLAEDSGYLSSLSRYSNGQNRDKIINFLDHLYHETVRNLWKLLADIRAGIEIDTNVSVLQGLLGKINVFLHRYENMRNVYKSDSSAFARLGIIRDKYYTFLNTLYRDMVIDKN